VDVLQHLLEAALLDFRIDLLRHDLHPSNSKGCGIKPGALHTFPRPLALTVAALGVGLALTGCTAQHDPAAKSDPTTKPSSAAATNTGSNDERPDSDSWHDADGYWSAISSPLVKAWLDDDPTGTGPQIALRFLQALQDHDDLAADRELSGLGRMTLATRDLDYLHAVMNDIRRNAGLDDAGRCRDADWADSDHVAVDCGNTTFVVKVFDDAPASGVRISDWDGHDDAYHGPHTDAYTTFEL